MAKYSGRVRDPQALGQFLEQARVLHGLSQRELAAKLGVSQRYVWEMEAGEPTLWAKRLFAFMRQTGMTLSATIDTEDEDE
ncbi:MAG: helix-turn-helix domain-containing protein [Propionibacteriaceae bacterium]|nr:helix-turn-helix domain-containing protein [Propionibacteriaceae bacterium]